MALLVLLALAFANPFITRPAARTPAGRLVLLVIDDSFSMRAGTRMNDAKREALSVLASRRSADVYLGMGHAVTGQFETGDIGYVPMGAGHYIRNTGSGILRLLAEFKNGHYRSHDLSAWVASNSARCVGCQFRPATNGRGSAS